VVYDPAHLLGANEQAAASARAYSGTHGTEAVRAGELEQKYPARPVDAVGKLRPVAPEPLELGLYAFGQ